MQIHEIDTEAVTLADLQGIKAYEYRSFLHNADKLQNTLRANSKTIKRDFANMYAYGLQLEAELNTLRRYTYNLLRKNITMQADIKDYQACIDELDKQIEGLE